jgi:hypothetical protein
LSSIREAASSRSGGTPRGTAGIEGSQVPRKGSHRAGGKLILERLAVARSNPRAHRARAPMSCRGLTGAVLRLMFTWRQQPAVPTPRGLRTHPDRHEPSGVCAGPSLVHSLRRCRARACYKPRAIAVMVVLAGASHRLWSGHPTPRGAVQSNGGSPLRTSVGSASWRDRRAAGSCGVTRRSSRRTCSADSTSRLLDPLEPLCDVVRATIGEVHVRF